ncbi:hypothetical protein M422DRAFT_228117 [Sphaerobolus stellatus SS14]|uniref:Protein-S-isoprenylcysteine O-methyltransferase n=1 Tax=Sphaerobolus stellatus (strain SS14) TaxID=990650 RepID=A0A0C9VCM3_SPHS4|nr:hypothetical protein M422DRAFT_228117 [Sphaerobolus stellatus SS14]
MIFVKLCMLLLSAAMACAAVSPPQGPPNKQDKVNEKRFMDRHVMAACYIYSTFFVFRVSMECVAIISTCFPDAKTMETILSITCPNYSRGPDHERIPLLLPPSFIIGVAGIVLGSAIRILCFRTLDRFFTFQITIRQNHRLIDSGPYGVVRHPSYVGGAFAILGTTILSVGPRSYPWACGLATSSALVTFTLWLWIIFLVYWTYSLLRRAPIEDEELRTTFGKEWEEYAKKVPYLFIPGII